MKNYFVIFLFILLSCRPSDDKPKRSEADSLAAILNADPIKPTQDKNLIWTESIPLGELGADNYEKLMSKKGMPTIKYLDELIYISAFIECESCGTYFPNIKITKDTLKYTFVSGSNIACTSLSGYHVRYLIRNPDNKKYAIVED